MREAEVADLENGNLSVTVEELEDENGSIFLHFAGLTWRKMRSILVYTTC